jgi:uncharacterized protein YrrD
MVFLKQRKKLTQSEKLVHSKTFSMKIFYNKVLMEHLCLVVGRNSLLKKIYTRKIIETKDGKFFGKIETQNNLQGTIGTMMFDSCWKLLFGKIFC